MTEPVNVTTESGAVADGDEAPSAESAGTGSGHGDPSAAERGTDGDADLQSAH
ncbi:hypothetical protein [Nakamurella deserti]|uniref:hypothetical protein n=1 Tax=Nakamurella deserti TaxID=2164074 RepID=UPI0013009509|nr:hypothetical protein [Nakamurella deserti]